MGLPLRILARLLAGALALSVWSVAGIAQQLIPSPQRG